MAPVRIRALFLAPLLAAAGCAPSGPSGSDTRSDTPFILPHALARAEKVYACEQAGWADAVASVPGIGERRVVRVPAFDEEGMPSAGLLSSWTTDEWLFGWKGRAGAVLKMPGDQGLAGWGCEHFSKLKKRGFYITLVKPREEGDPERRFDEGGAVMASPPIKNFPHGRLIVARDLQPAIKDFFRRQRVQAGMNGALVELDTAWLKVGHVDELVGFLPAAGAPGFKLVAPDPEAAMKLLAELPPERACFAAAGSREHAGAVTESAIRWIESAGDLPEGKWGFVRIIKGRGARLVAKVRSVKSRRITIEKVWDTRDFSDAKSPALGLARALAGRCDTMPIWFDRPDATSRYLLVEDSKMWIDAAGDEFPAVVAAGELAADRTLARMNAAVAKRCREAERLVRAALGLDGKAIVRLPGLFAAPGEGDTGAFSLTPSLVNLQVFNREVVLLRPAFARRDAGDDGTDLILAAARRALAAPDIRLHFIDGWDALHRNNGGARCGMNVWRARR